MKSSTETSLVVTLGVAAIDMLCCAFVCSVVLFLIFLLPQRAASSDAAGTEDLLLIKWSLDTRTDVVLGVEITPPGDTPAMIWTDDPSSMTDACARLSLAKDLRNSCYMITPDDPRSLEGLLVIERPKPGEWGAIIHSSDTKSHYYAPDSETVALDLVVVGTEVFTYRVSQLKPGASINLRSAQGEGVNLNALRID
ncbi:hypothetical protein ABIF62_001999 [Bradyrhizobium japonicum]